MTDADIPEPVPPPAAIDFQPVPRVRRRDGWTAERQRLFLDVLAQTGSISDACDAVNMTPRSAYRLRCHPAGRSFADAWEQALTLAAGRLMTLAYERAINGVPRTVWRDDKVVAETRVPSERLLMYLLTHLMPRTFGGRPAQNRQYDYRQSDAREGFPRLAAKLADIAEADCPGEQLGASDFEPAPPLPERG